MIITPNGAEPVKKQTHDFNNSVEQAISNGLEDAMEDKGRECDYEFTIQTRNGIKRVLCEIFVDNGYMIPFEHEEDEHVDLAEIERSSYQFLLERL